MSEIQKTMTLAGVAILLVLSALLTAPTKITPDTFLDRGEPFFPEFTDPNVATTLEVIEFNQETATARPFKVTFKEGRWTIPSHHDYPADGKDQLATTAAGVIEIKKDDYRSDNVADHEAFGVIGPLDETATTLKGRGKRVTIKGKSDEILADLIIGNSVEGRSNLRLVRLPDQKRVYAARVDIEISTKFEDWIERDLLQVERRNVNQITLKDYSINERTGTVDQRDVLILDKTDDTWKANRMSSNQEVDSSKMSDLLTAIDDLSIVGVRPKPAGLSRSLTRSEQGQGLSQPDVLSLQSKGYYFTRNGNLVSNEGELEVRTSDGIIYTLRFGEVLYGTGEAVTAGTDSSDDKESGPGENRYLFVTTSFDPKQLSEPAKPGNTDFLNKSEEDWTDTDRKNKELKDQHDQWQEKMRQGQELSDELNARFANWYYVISSGSFDKVHLNRSDLVKMKES
ncbi:DUF4340 domain-containing protein [Acidobacteria bacterium AH-259-D05]|nr:DUF4340 domain-containing protein [Acidobacteria bacterium AH-259-D05]